MKRWLIGLVLALVCGAVIWFLLYGLTYEPTYQGRTLSAWLNAAAFQDVAWWPGQAATDHAICAMGTNALLPLFHYRSRIELKQSNVKARISSWLKKHGFGPQAIRFYDPYGQERLRAYLGGIDALKPRAAEVVPALIGIYKDRSDYRLDVLTALGGLQAREAIPFLLLEASSTNPAVRVSVHWAMGLIHAEAQSVVPVLVKGLEDSDIRVGASAAEALRMFGPQAQQAVPALTWFAGQESEAWRREPDSAERRVAHRNAEAALDAITGRKAGRIIFDPRWRSPENPYGQCPPPQTNAMQPGAETLRTNSPP